MQIERHKPLVGWRPFTALFYGIPKVGKSTEASKFSPKGIDGTLMIDTENGTDELDCNRIQVDSMDSFKNALTVALDSDFDTVVIDTIDRVYDWAEKIAISILNERLKKDYTSIEEFEYGVGYAVARNQLLNIVQKLNRFKANGKVLLLISHQKAVSGDGGEKNRTIDLPGKLSRSIAAHMDAIGLILSRKDKNTGKATAYVNFLPYDLVDAGCRLHELAAKEIPFSFKAVFAEFQKELKPKKVLADGDNGVQV